MLARRARRSLTVIIVLFLLVADGAVAQKRKPAFEKPPRLILIIVLDQFRYDYLQRFSDPIARRVLRGFNTERNGDLIIVQKPFHYLGDSADPANHGSSYSYDTHVPLIIMGSGFKATRFGQPATPADIAPTISFALQIRPPNKSQARILREALTFK